MLQMEGGADTLGVPSDLKLSVTDRLHMFGPLPACRVPVAQV